MSDIELGRKVQSLTVDLVDGDPFALVLRRFDKKTRQPVDWQSAPTLDFPEAGVDAWVSTISGNEATFAVPQAEVHALVLTKKKRSVLSVGGVTWAIGAWRVVTGS